MGQGERVGGVRVNGKEEGGGWLGGSILLMTAHSQATLKEDHHGDSLQGACGCKRGI